GLERPTSFDLVRVGEASERAPQGAVVFLHGFGGNFTLPCWLVAQAARRAGLVTFCPSIRPAGDWWQADGEATLRRTVQIVRARGIDRIYLAGLSNGGIGASRLAPRMRGSFRGLVLISGAAADAPAPGVPALVIHGRRDAMVAVSVAARYASRTGARFVGESG